MTRSATLEQVPLTRLKGVGPALEAKLHGLGILNVQDLLFHLPYSYQDRTRINPIKSLHFGDTVQIEGEIVSSTVVFGRRRSLQCVVRDPGGIITLRFFFFSPAQQKTLQPGARLRCYGEVRRGRHGLEIYHPEYRFVTAEQEGEVEQRLTPIYPTTENLQQARLRAIIEQALQLLQRAEQITDYLPESVLARQRFMPLDQALHFLHHPPPDVDLSLLEAGTHPAQQRLAFEELLSHRLCMRRLRLAANQRSAPAMVVRGSLLNDFIASLPFKLTAAQQRTFREISADMANPHPMLRLLQGDVGSGKTLVAALTALQAVANGYQAVIMAPTEILAEQHFANFSRWMGPLDIGVGWLSGKLTGKARDTQLAAIAQGSARIIVGTHALFQSAVEYARLGLVIIDEQHRFGVHQRMALRDKADIAGLNPHQLVMTATPIPRTLAMSAYADLDCSVIDELPPGRTPVTTLLIDSGRRPEVVDRIREACRKGNQAYWVCTLIEESEALQCQAAEATATLLQEQLPDLRLGLVHGRMKPRDKARVMAAFKEGELQLLVATTVIEVGVDVPNASLMVIENPERLGLAQLHQLRGRVGRGALASYCILLYQTPLSETSKHRLTVMKQSNDGFFIAEKDLEIRGPGQVLGTQQTGLMQFRVADIARDGFLLDAVRDHAETILADYPDRVEPLVHRWLGDREHYGKV
ncbi:MAG: hypothetical protein RLZZ385_169 [Pseudomonadota bacterium]|jgi:ATP-dependent DNA helicase RecG